MSINTLTMKDQNINNKKKKKTANYNKRLSKYNRKLTKLSN